MVQGNAVQQSVTRGNRSSKLAMIKHIKTQLSNSDSPGIRGLRTKLRWKGRWGGVGWGDPDREILVRALVNSMSGVHVREIVP